MYNFRLKENGAGVEAVKQPSRNTPGDLNHAETSQSFMAGEMLST